MVPGRNMGINTDTGHGRTMDPDIVFSRIPGQNVTMVKVTAQATQIGMASEAVWSSETNMAPGGSSDHRSLHDLQQ